MIRAIIFDFDGVIVDSVDVKGHAFAEIYTRFGGGIAEKVLSHHRSNGGMLRKAKFKFYHDTFLDYKLSNQELSKLESKFSGLVLERVITAPFINGAHEFLQENHNVYDLYISTATPESEIITILHAREIHRNFKGVYGSPRPKKDHVKKILKIGHYSNSEIVFVGDSITDKNAAIQNQTHFIGKIDEYNGFENEKFWVNDLTELSSVIKVINKRER